MSDESKTTVLTQVAVSPGKGMTLREMEVFILEAKLADIDPEAKVFCRVGFSWNIQALEVKG